MQFWGRSQGENKHTNVFLHKNSALELISVGELTYFTCELHSRHKLCQKERVFDGIVKVIRMLVRVPVLGTSSIHLLQTRAIHGERHCQSIHTKTLHNFSIRGGGGGKRRQLSNKSHTRSAHMTDNGLYAPRPCLGTHSGCTECPYSTCRHPFCHQRAGACRECSPWTA